MVKYLHNKTELFIYITLWLCILFTPIIGFFMQNTDDESLTFSQFWQMGIWKQYIIFLIAFLVHNFFLAPLLIYRQKRVAYVAAVIALLATFVIIQGSIRPFDRGPHPQEQSHHRPPLPPDFDDEHLPEPDRPHEIGHRPPFIYRQHDVIATIMLFLMLGMNLGVKLYFKQRDDQRRLTQLEKENLEQQLEHLKYQINPHFLMNTLNNIHALVDIDQEKAKEAIMELSKIMRFVLHDGARKTVPIRQEIEFLRNYIQLMRLRYTDKVSIRLDIPQEQLQKEMPPLMLVTFVENAFKHGVSYRQDSFIDIKIEYSPHPLTLKFLCSNSRIPKSEDQHGGVGLQNVKRRLELIYGRNYTLDIKDLPDSYNIRLEIPL